MMRAVVVSILGVALATGAAPAGDESAQPSSCAMVRSIYSWEPIDAKTAYIYASPERKFKVTFVGSCRDMKWAQFARIERRASSGICVAPGDEIIFGHRPPHMGNPDSDIPLDEQRCMIKSIEAAPRVDEAPANKPAP